MAERIRWPAANSSLRYTSRHRDEEAMRRAAMEQCLKDEELSQQLAGRSSIVMNLPRSSRRYRDLIPLGDPSASSDDSPPTNPRHSGRNERHTSSTQTAVPAVASRKKMESAGREALQPSLVAGQEKVMKSLPVAGASAGERLLRFYSDDLFPEVAYVTSSLPCAESASAVHCVAPPASSSLDLYRAIRSE